MEDASEITLKTPLNVATPSAAAPKLQVDTPGSLYHPSEAISVSFIEKGEDTLFEATPREHLNAFLVSRDVSPIRHSLVTHGTQLQIEQNIYTQGKQNKLLILVLKKLLPKTTNIF